MTSGTSRGDIILRLTDMTESDSFSRGKFMITYADRTIFTFRDGSTSMTNHSSSVSFLIYQDSDFLSLFDIFFDTITRQLGKIRSNLVAHIYQENGFLGSLDFVVKAFVVHKRNSMEISPRFKL